MAFKEWHEATGQLGRAMSQRAFSDWVCDRDDIVKLPKSCGIVKFQGVSLAGSVGPDSDAAADESREQGSIGSEKPLIRNTRDTSLSPMGNRQNAPYAPLLPESGGDGGSPSAGDETVLDFAEDLI